MVKVDAWQLAHWHRCGLPGAQCGADPSAWPTRGQHACTRMSIVLGGHRVALSDPAASILRERLARSSPPDRLRRLRDAPGVPGQVMRL
jgi:hypothetical protein